MNPHMICKMGRLLERVFAHQTSIRTLPSMNSQVDCKITFLMETFLAYRTKV